MKKYWLMTSVLMTSLVVASCATVPPEKSLYDRIGGHEVMVKIVSETIDSTCNDPKTKRSFEGVKISQLKESITSQFCMLTGGGCKYEGETMKNSHADAKITSAEFELMVQHLRDAIDHQQVGAREKNELLKILAPMKRDVVTN